jgi:hypothetical protein
MIWEVKLILTFAVTFTVSYVVLQITPDRSAAERWLNRAAYVSLYCLVASTIV